MSADDSTCYPYCLQDFGSPRQQLEPNLQLAYRLVNRVAAASHWTHFRRVGLGRYEFWSGFSSAGRDFARLKGANPANIPIWQERV
jgi:hypothetical protein